MAPLNVEKIMNGLLDPVLFQVIGSTPESIAGFIAKSGIKGEADPGVRLATIATFAAAVNKATMETFLSKPEMASVRSFIMNAFQVSGKVNMTALSLLGHCLMGSTFLDNVNFVTEFRRKMGQNDLWAGTLESGSLGEKQRKILQEKKRLTTAASAALLRSGFWKYIGVDAAAFTIAEANFWGEPLPAARHTPAQKGRVSPSDPETIVPLPDGSSASIPRILAEYYMTVFNTNLKGVGESVARSGVNAWITRYGQIEKMDPARTGQGGSTVIG
jgi:hypothetical protein